jgi:hypothetical protein
LIDFWNKLNENVSTPTPVWLWKFEKAAVKTVEDFSSLPPADYLLFIPFLCYFG